MLRGKKVLLGVTASIAAYKSTYLVRLLIKAGAEVKVILTPSARDFVTPLTLSTLSKHPVFIEYFKGDTGEWNSHVELAEWGDIFIIAPLSANTLAKMANGICDNLLLATYLSARCPIFFAPAMDLEMYRQETVQDNIQKLQSMGHHLIAATSGELASGLDGEGRMEEPEIILERLDSLEFKTQVLKGRKVLVTGGPTRENIDPVRYLTNHSSGRMGLAIAREAQLRGAEVTLIHGPINLSIPPGIEVVPVITAEEMHTACLKYFDQFQVIIMSAAVADFRPLKVQKDKIKKSDQNLSIELEKTKDILRTMGEKKRNDQYLVGFALETANERKNALTKLKAKNLDLIVLNSLRDDGAGFNHSTNKVTLINAAGQEDALELKTKSEVASDILDAVIKDLK